MQHPSMWLDRGHYTHQHHQLECNNKDPKSFGRLRYRRPRTLLPDSFRSLRLRMRDERLDMSFLGQSSGKNLTSQLYLEPVFSYPRLTRTRFSRRSRARKRIGSIFSEFSGNPIEASGIPSRSRRLRDSFGQHAAQVHVINISLSPSISNKFKNSLRRSIKLVTFISFNVPALGPYRKVVNHLENSGRVNISGA